jgi:predicted ABC-type transport system involved in lysophospholipase L1 biosynthesis ATPase subunit
VLADEPTGNLDSETGEAILDLLAEWNRERRITLLVATHDPRIIGRVPRRIELRDGRIQTDGPPEEAA